VLPLSEFPIKERRAVRGVLCDIDDTLTTGGRLTADAYAAMERLERAGLQVIPITGRPAGWCDHIARMWPAAAVVGENGAFSFRYDRAARIMRRRYVHDAATRAAHREQLQKIAASILAEVPGAAIAADQAYRETDLAIDYCEDVARLPREAVDRIVALMQARGLTAKVSSIHVNGWFGAYDKLAATRSWCARNSAPTSTLLASPTCSSATRPTTRRCSSFFRTRSASPTSANSRAVSRMSLVTSLPRPAARVSAKSRISFSPRARERPPRRKGAKSQRYNGCQYGWS